MSNKIRSASVEDYLKAIHFASQESRENATSKALAARLGVTAPSVTGMLKKLEEKGLVEYSPYAGATLSRQGHARAMKVLRRHRLVELFLHKCLQMSWDEIHDEAEILEHALSEKLERKIDEWLGNPRFDPHGAPIPDESGRIVKRELISLADLDSGVAALIAEVRGTDSALLGYFKERGILPNKRIVVLEEGEYGGSVKVRTANRIRYVGRTAAEKVMVEIVRGD